MGGLFDAYHETKLFLTEKGIKLTNQQILNVYMVLGGIPLYLDQIQRNLSVAQNIDELCFTKRGLLFTEFSKLFASLFKEHEICLTFRTIQVKVFDFYHKLAGVVQWECHKFF